MTERARKANGLKEKYLLNMLDGQTTYINIWIYTYLCTYNTIIHILYTHIYIQQKGVQRVITYIYNGRPQPACRHKAIVVMRRMGALDCLHDVTIYVYIYICIYICMYVCIYIYIHKHIDSILLQIRYRDVMNIIYVCYINVLYNIFHSIIYVFYVFLCINKVLIFKFLFLLFPCCSYFFKNVNSLTKY